MTVKKASVLAAVIAAVLFLFLFFTLVHSDTTVDPDTVSCLLSYGRGTVTWQNPVIWNVHIYYGTFLLIGSIFTSHLIAPAAFLSAVSTVIFLLAGFRILLNHVNPRQALWGFVLLAAIPGYHLLNLRLEDNLPLLAGIALMAAAMDTIHLKGVTLPRLVLAAAGFTLALVFHTITIVFAWVPLLILFQNTRMKKKVLYVILMYLCIIIMTAGMLAVIPAGFRHFAEAYTGSYGIESNVSAFSSQSAEILERLKKDWVLPFREVNNIPLDISKIGSPLIALVFRTAVVLTNILFYGAMVYGIILSWKKRKENTVLLAMLLAALAVPLGLAAFTIERMDMPVLFGTLLAVTGWSHLQEEKNKAGFTALIYAALLGILVLWDGALYAQCARWVYRPPQYLRYQRMLQENSFDYSSGRAMLFTEEESLFENTDYFLFIKNYPEMIHYGIENDGKMYRIDGGWPNDKVYISGQDIFQKEAGVYITGPALQRYREHHVQTDNFIIIKE